MLTDVTIAAIYVFIMGLAIGSFLNVVIYRAPRHVSVAAKGSACPSCSTPIKWYDNIPLVSFLVLRGKCRACGAPISARYPGVEALTALVFLAVFYKHISGRADIWGWQSIVGLIAYLWFAGTLIAESFIDAEHRIIPNSVNYPALAVGLVLLGVSDPSGWINMLIGVAVGFGSLFLLRLAGPLLFGKQGMGMGDVKLGAVMGIFLGWQVALALFAASLFGSVYGVIMILAGRQKWREHFAFGPFLAIGAAVTYFAGDPIISWYLSLFS